MMARARSASGLTLIQLVYWTTVMMGLIMLLYPIFLQPREHGPRSNCMSNLKQLGLAVLLYSQDYDDTYPAYDPPAEGSLSGTQGKAVAATTGAAEWVNQLLPYVKNRKVFACSEDANPNRNLINPLLPGSAIPFAVSYGPNRMFMHPSAYGWKKQIIRAADVVDPAAKYLMGDCVTAHGFDLGSIAYLRYPNYDPATRRNGWGPRQFLAAGQVAWPDEVARSMTRHTLGSNVVFADGHACWLRHDRIPENEGPGDSQSLSLKAVMIPWQ